MFLKQFKRELLVAFRESAVADHVREHDSCELAMFGAVLRHITATLWTSLPEPSLQGKDCGATGLNPSQGFTSSPWQRLAMERPNSIQAELRNRTGQP